MEQQNKLDTPIGTLEPQKLDPKAVKVVKVSVEEATFGDKKWDVLVFDVKHPDKEEVIQVKKVKYEKDNRMKIVGTALNFDADGKINKVSALAHLMKFYGVTKPIDFVGKEIQTTQDDRDFLCFKAY